MTQKTPSLFDWNIVGPAIGDSFRKLDPRLMIIPIMAMAGSLVQKKLSPPSAGTFPVSGGTFVVLLLGTILLVGALNFLPVLALGPIVEHFLMLQGKLF